jgi:hypothetical protein
MIDVLHVHAEVPVLGNLNPPTFEHLPPPRSHRVLVAGPLTRRYPATLRPSVPPSFLQPCYSNTRLQLMC